MTRFRTYLLRDPFERESTVQIANGLSGEDRDFASVIIDGGFPDWVRTRIVAATRSALGLHDLQGVTIPEIIEGQVGSQARAIGGASLPLFSRYLIDQNVLFKDTTG